MNTSASACETSIYQLSSDIDWAGHYPRLLSLARRFVYMYRIQCWRGQEEDLAEDVVQETLRRTIERIHKAERGEAPPIDSLERMMVIIARNYVLDMIRHEYCVIRISPDDSAHEMGTNVNNLASLSETATENVYHEWLFLQIAYEISQMPCKQRRALLIDLANRISFSTQRTPLQTAFLTVDIDLREYQQSLLENVIERARHSSLVSLAYKRIAQIVRLHQYISAV